MKRHSPAVVLCALVALSVFTLMGCGPTANQLAGEKAFYEAKIALQKQTTSQPVFEMVAGDPKQPIVLQNVSALRVYQLPSGGSGDVLTQYVQKDYAQPYLNFLSGLASVVAPWWGMTVVVDKVAGIAAQKGNTINTLTNTVSGQGNSLTAKTGIGDVNVNASGNTGTMSLGGPVGVINDMTSTPTVVTQPPPVIVPSVIVPPVIVQPSYPPSSAP